MEHKIHQYCKIYGLNPKDVEYKIDLWDFYLAIAFHNRESAIEKHLIDKKQ